MWTKQPGNSESKQQAIGKIRKSFSTLNTFYRMMRKSLQVDVGVLLFYCHGDAMAKATYRRHSLLRNTVSEGESPQPSWPGAWQQAAVAESSHGD